MANKYVSPNHREAITAVSSITGQDEYLHSTNGILDVGATFSASSIAISDGSSSAIKATVLDLTDSNPLTVAITDANGDQVTSFGGGTQYTDGGVPPVHPIGGTIEWSDGVNWQTVSTARPLPVTATFSPSGTQDVNITKVAGASVATGHGTAAGALRVELPTDGTGLVGVAQSGTWAVTANAGTNLNTSALALAATQTDKSQFTKLTDGTDTALITASGEQNVLATAQPGVDIGDVTINNAGGAAAVNIQDGGNSITVDGTVAVTQSTSPWTVTGGGTAGTAATGVVTIQGIASMTKLLVTPDANSAINLAQVGGTTVVNGGVAGSQSVGGTVATNVAITANPLNLGAQAVSSENSAVTTARQVQLVADLVGKLIVLPYANPENFVSGAATATDTTSTSLIAAPASGLRNYITQITVWNASAVNTYIKIQDGSGGTTLYTLPCPTVGGSVITLPTPLRQPTTATAIFFAANASANAVFISASGYKGV